MATYLPVLLVSVSAGMPDDAALQPLPRGQVDYLSHEWAEEDVWRSWRNMTKQKNEIANGARLENASWRTWWKQRNGLGTVSPETLNWLKDSDVTWLYGPLHTAVDWTPFPKQTPPPISNKSKDDAVALPSKSTAGNSMSSPSSSVTLDRLHPPVSRFSVNSQDGNASHSGIMKPILKHRSITEMLTSALPPTPIWATEDGILEEDEEDSDTQEDSGNAGSSSEQPGSSFEGGRSPRPSLLHTKSDTNILPRFGRNISRKKARISPPRVASAMADRDSQSLNSSGLLSASQRSGASNNLAEMALHSGGAPYWASGPSAPPSLESAESSGGTSVFTSDAASTKSEGENLSPSAPPVVPQRKHISFNAIVEQCIAIDGGSAPASPFANRQPWSEYDDGYVEDEEDGLFEDANPRGESDSDDDHIDEEEMLEIKPPTRRSSTGSINEFRVPFDAIPSASQQTVVQERPNFRRQPNSYKPSRSRTSHSGSRSGSASGSTSQASRSRSTVATGDREHVSIAPIAPTILKAGGGSDHSEDGLLYMGGAPFNGQVQGNAGLYNTAYANNYGGSGVYGPGSGSGSGFAYGYGGYGYGEQVSAGRGSAYEHFERGTDAGELVYCGPDGSVYPWSERDAERFQTYTEYGTPNFGNSPPRPAYPMQSQQQRDGPILHSIGSSMIDFNAHSSSSTDSNEGAEFEYFDRIEEEIEDDNQMDFSSPPDLLSHETAKKLQEGSSHLIVINSIGDSDNSENKGSQISNSPRTSYTPSVRERTPSPDFQPKVNPRIASLKSESGFLPAPQSPSSPVEQTALPPPTLAIPTPGISPAHAQEIMTMRSPPESPIMRTGLLSPPDMSPRGRSGCSSPISGSATSSSGVPTSSRSVSESRSDSRGRSRTRNSSVSASSDAEPDRGRSRSRSTASGANSPLESSSPLGRVSNVSIGGLGLGIGISSGFGSPYNSRDVRDGRGVKLYRKTSEDCIAGSATEVRGRNRSGKRVSESLSPPTVCSAPSGGVRRVAVSPPNLGSPHRPISSSNLGSQSYSMNLSGHSIANTGFDEREVEDGPSFTLKSDNNSLDVSPNAGRFPEPTELLCISEHENSDRPDISSDDGSCLESGSSTVTSGRGPSASSLDEEYRNLFSSSLVKASQPNPQFNISSSGAASDFRKQSKSNHPSENIQKASSPPPGPTPARAPDVKVEKTLASGSTTLPTSGKSQKVNELVSSARTLLGTIWNGSS